MFTLKLTVLFLAGKENYLGNHSTKRPAERYKRASATIKLTLWLLNFYYTIWCKSLFIIRDLTTVLTV